MKSSKSDLPGIILAAVCFIILQWPLYNGLGDHAIYQWDEAIYALNALDMYFSGDPIVLTRGGELTLYNTKPPLGIWLQVLSMKVFGLSEFALRFPSALAGSLTYLTLLIFAHRSLKDIRIGILGMVLLGTADGFVRQHVTRSADLDALLVLWITLYSCLALHMFITDRVRSRTILWAAIGVALAFLTKSSAGFFALPALIVGAFVSGNGMRFLKNKGTYIGIALIAVTAIGYYALRESLAPGYIDHMFRSEYSRYTTQITPWHARPWNYYLQNLVNRDFFTPFAYLIPICIAVGLWLKKYRKVMLQMSVLLVGMLTAISIPAIKLEWYDAPLYPWYALVTALGLMAILEHFLPRWKSTGVGVLIIIVFVLKWNNVVEVEQDVPFDKLEYPGFTMKKMRESSSLPQSFNIFTKYETNAHYTQNEWYVQLYNSKGYDIHIVRDMSELVSGDTVLSCQPELIETLRADFKIKKVSGDEYCSVFTIE